MAKFIGDDQLRRVKEAVDLVDLMADYAPPQKAGAQFSVCCPFHQERSPSCYIYPDQQTYHCFGCGAHGDSITLVREQEGLNLSTPLNFCAPRRYSACFRREVFPCTKKGPSKSEREQLLELMRFATSFTKKRCSTKTPPKRLEATSRVAGLIVNSPNSLAWALPRSWLARAGGSTAGVYPAATDFGKPCNGS